MNTQKGSAHVIIILGLVVLLIGSLGFIYWQNFIKSDPEPQATAQPAATEVTDSKDTQPQDEYTGTYTSGGNFQVKIPNGWTVDAGAYDGYPNSQLVLLAGPNRLESLKYNKDVNPVINNVAGFGWGGLTEHFYIISQETAVRDFNNYVKSTFELENGTKGEKYAQVLTKDQQQQMDTFQKEADKYTSTTYEFTKGDVTVRAYLHYYSNTTFDVDLGEKVVRSIRF